MINYISAIFLTIIISLSSFKSNAAEPKIVTTIRPIHSITSYITYGVTEPSLLLKGNESPHDYAIRPSDMQKIENADLIFFISPELESSFAKVFKNRHNADVTSLIDIKDIKLLPVRGKNQSDGHDDEHENHNHHHGEIDPHIWLSPENAIKITNFIANKLAEKDAINAEKYKKNAGSLIEEIRADSLTIREKLLPYRKSPYLVLHDAFQYFEEYFELNHAGSIMSQSNHSIGAKRLKELEQEIDDKKIECIFSEPQFSSKMIKPISQKKKISIGLIDPIGYDVEKGKQTYLELLNNIADNMLLCLQK